jgi:tetratricopeptide (TPR) repeat protein
MVVSRLGDEIIARRLADTLVRLWPDEAFAWQAAGEALEWFDLEGAGACYEKAYALDGTNLRRRVRVADNLYRRGLGDLAEAEMLECLRLGAEEAVVYEVLARLHAARDDFEGAVPYARKAVAISLETNRTAYIGYAKLLMDMLERAGRPDEAFAYARTAIAEEPQLTDFHELLINIHLNRKEFDEAAELSSDMIARSPDDHYAWFTRGRVLWAQGRLDETIEAFRKCCALKPDDVPAWTNLAMVLARREEHLPEAIRTARKAVVLSGYTQAHPLWVLGTALLRAGELDDAEHVYRTGLDIESLEGNRNPRLRSELENGLKTVRARMARADESGKR